VADLLEEGVPAPEDERPSLHVAVSAEVLRRRVEDDIAPSAIGRCRAGVAKVPSTRTSAPRVARRDAARRSVMARSGFDGVSSQTRRRLRREPAGARGIRHVAEGRGEPIGEELEGGRPVSVIDVLGRRCALRRKRLKNGDPAAIPDAKASAASPPSSGASAASRRSCIGCDSRCRCVRPAHAGLVPLEGRREWIGGPPPGLVRVRPRVRRSFQSARVLPERRRAGHEQSGREVRSSGRARRLLLAHTGPSLSLQAPATDEKSAARASSASASSSRTTLASEDRDEGGRPSPAHPPRDVNLGPTGGFQKKLVKFERAPTDAGRVRRSRAGMSTPRSRTTTVSSTRRSS